MEDDKEMSMVRRERLLTCSKKQKKVSLPSSVLMSLTRSSLIVHQKEGSTKLARRTSSSAFNDKLISQQMLEATIASVHPSISKEVADSYENLRHKMEETETRNKRSKIGFVQ